MFSLFKKHKNVNLDDPSVSCSSGTSKNDIGVNDLGTLSTGPRRPVLASYKKSQFGKQLRSFRSQWFNDFEWLEYSIERNAAFCYVCRIFSTGNCTQDVWTHSGFDNWQKFCTKVNGHFFSKNHLTNVEKMNSYKKTKETGSVITQISSFHKEEVTKNRKYMSNLIEIVLYLAKQGISYRGHDEKCDSLNQDFENFYNKKISQTSWKVQEEIIGICADLVRQTIIDNIVMTGHFALMVDEARSHKQEQLSVCIRYAVGLESHERFLQFVDVSSGQDANSIVAAIYQCFENLNISMNSLHIVAQSYDGASVMSGCLGGVQAKIKEKYPNAIYTHCMAHRLNLVVVDMCKGVKCARNVFNTLEMLYVHFSRPSNCSKLISIQSKLELRKGNVLRICDTRWVCRFKNCDAMIKNYPAILKFLINEVEEQNDKDAVEAIGILSQINNCNFLIGVTLLKDVLCIINMLSTTLQSKSATLGKAKETINGVNYIVLFDTTYWLKIAHKYTDDDIIGNAILLFVAGAETISSMVSFCLYELALNKEIQDKLRAEILSMKAKHDGKFNNEFLMDLHYTNMVLEETVRKYTISPMILRVATQTYTLPDESFVIEKGQKLIIPTFSIHRDPKYYPDPLKFDPERFSMEQKSQRPNGIYLPFGDGPRICIGKRFAESEMKLVLSNVLSKFEVLPCEQTEIPLDITSEPGILTPKRGLVLKFRPIVEH